MKIIRKGKDENLKTRLIPGSDLLGIATVFLVLGSEGKGMVTDGVGGLYFLSRKS